MHSLLAMLAAACTSSEPQATTSTSTSTPTTTLEHHDHHDRRRPRPDNHDITHDSGYDHHRGDTATTATTVWVDPPPTTSTTTPAPEDNEAPFVEITSPGNLSSHVAAYDPDLDAFRAVVSMSATVSDPDDDQVAVDWFSSLSGYLGTGEFITASLVTIYDSSQPFITARATDEHGAVFGTPDSDHRLGALRHVRCRLLDG